MCNDTKALIISVGGTHEPLVKTIMYHRPEYVVFFPSQKTTDTITRTKDGLATAGMAVVAEQTVVNDGDDLLECYQQALDAITRVEARGYRPAEVVVDYTCATKSMAVALALAAIDKGYSFSYVGGERTGSGIGIVETGHEQVNANVNPWDFLGVDERRQAGRFFNSCQFKAGVELLQELSRRSAQQKLIYRRLAMIFDGYRQWDSFKHRDAITCFSRAKIDELLELDLKDGVRRFCAETNALLEQLKHILETSGQGKKPCAALAHDLYANAERRFAEGSVDDAILRLYRLAEMTAQMRLLEQYQITASDVRPEQIPARVRGDYVARHTYHDGRIKLALYAAYTLLLELDDPLGQAYQANEQLFRNVQRARNESYLAHGFASSSDKTYEDLREFILALGVITPAKAPRFPEVAL